MPRAAAKRRATASRPPVPGGEEPARVSSAGSPALRDALAAAAEGASAAGGPDAARLIDLELIVLLEGRRYFLDWVESLRRDEEAAPGDPPSRGAAAAPAQFLRAWSDATARVVQLLKARQGLAGEEGAYGPLLEQVIAELERSPGLLFEEVEEEEERA